MRYAKNNCYTYRALFNGKRVHINVKIAWPGRSREEKDKAGRELWLALALYSIFKKRSHGTLEVQTPSEILQRSNERVETLQPRT